MRILRVIKACCCVLGVLPVTAAGTLSAACHLSARGRISAFPCTLSAIGKQEVGVFQFEVAPATPVDLCSKVAAVKPGWFLAGFVGGCTTDTKAVNAQQAGVQGVILASKAVGGPAPTIVSANGSSIDIWVLSTSRHAMTRILEDGQATIRATVQCKTCAPMPHPKINQAGRTLLGSVQLDADSAVALYTDEHPLAVASEACATRHLDATQTAAVRGAVYQLLLDHSAALRAREAESSALFERLLSLGTASNFALTTFRSPEVFYGTGQAPASHWFWIHPGESISALISKHMLFLGLHGSANGLKAAMHINYQFMQTQFESLGDEAGSATALFARALVVGFTLLAAVYLCIFSVRARNAHARTILGKDSPNKGSLPVQAQLAERCNYIDGVKGWACVMVCVFHIFQNQVVPGVGGSFLRLGQAPNSAVLLITPLAWLTNCFRAVSIFNIVSEYFLFHISYFILSVSGHRVPCLLSVSCRTILASISRANSPISDIFCVRRTEVATHPSALFRVKYGGSQAVGLLL